MDHPLQCQCGHVRGQLRHPERATHIRCYCHDCQAFAAFLGKREDLLDGQGGTDVLVVHPATVIFTEGRDAIKCMSLSPTGMYRWYAGCCNTAIGNTSRDRKMAFAGLAHTFLARSPQALEAAFGPARMVSATRSANGPVPSSGWRAIVPMLGFARNLLVARISGSYRTTPFFTDNIQPIVEPTVLTPAQREALGN